jgi:hypothetical protein
MSLKVISFANILVNTGAASSCGAVSHIAELRGLLVLQLLPTASVCKTILTLAFSTR